MFMNVQCWSVLVFLILGCNTTSIVPPNSHCPESGAWRDWRSSPNGPLLCARLYGNEKCSYTLLSFGINSSSSDIGIRFRSSYDPDFERNNNVTALVRPGCKMFLWESANFTGRHEKSTNYTWHVDRRHYSSALCNCSVDDDELLQCELSEIWVTLDFCDFRESNISGLCSAALKRSYTTDGNGETRNVTITENLASLFADKIVESFGEKRMASFLDINSNDNFAHSFLVEARTGINIKQRSYICGKYLVFTSEVLKQVRKNGLNDDLKVDKWIYNQNSETYFWFSSGEETHSGADRKCKEMGGKLAQLYNFQLKNWMKPLLASSGARFWWISGRHSGDAEWCSHIKYETESIYISGWTTFLTVWCNWEQNYICEREHDP